jgi:hypothetical protein
VRNPNRIVAIIIAIAASLRAQGQETSLPLTAREKMLVDRIEKLEQRLAALESRTETARPPEPTAKVVEPAPTLAIPTTAKPPSASDVLGGTTVNLYLDGYYEYNFNSPIGRANLLRAYDVSSNSFSLNQAGVVLENAPDPDQGKRLGARLDLQFGQATATLQGNGTNEPRPDIYRNIFQAYGTYVAPVGAGLTIDFGKWASSIGLEGNYTKDQNNYSRSFWFDYLPFYHEGVRASYKVNGLLTANYWIVNGTNQTEAFNGFKDELFGVVLQPTKTLNWTINYYLGQEHPDVIFYPNGGAPPNSPTIQGVPFTPIPNPPNGRLHIFDSYITWNASPKLSFALEGDSVVQRLLKTSPPQRAYGGAFYSRYEFTPKFAIAGRAEYLSDSSGLFSGLTQALKEATLTLDYRAKDSFLLRGEWRGDFSNNPYFYTNTLGVLKKEQNTATLALIWWYGQKHGIW